MANVKVMTYNLRVDNTGDGINSFTNRHERVLRMLAETRPDIIGFQECTHHMRAYLEQHMPDYAFVGCGREKDCTGESMAIAYRKGAFAVVKVDNFWLTATPSIPGSNLGGDQSGCPRMATVAVLHQIGAGKDICMCNTHLDHQGQIARQIEAALLCARLEQYAQPIILTGDMNAKPHAPEIAMIKEAMLARGARDVTEHLGGTFHDFGRKAPEKYSKIDYIFASGTCTDCHIVPDDADKQGLYYSDHFAVMAEIEI
ncbi:MAG: endonuclease/exonuclease/phosphatase family protein [Clostridia bacterium]|nr:endonuclease/exonuclease/phosphatase family protein [Clostridia bacterium]